VKVLDFGLVKDIGASGEAALTVGDAITGTPLYVAPEAVTAPETVDGRADLYALGAVGYWLLTGTDVFGGGTVLAALAHHVHSIPQPPSVRLGAPVSADLESLILSCLAKRPGDRPRSAHVLRDRLLSCEASGGWTTDRAAQWWADHRAGIRSRADHRAGTDARVAAGAPLMKAM
jgi:serine/threonine protein kinase